MYNYSATQWIAFFMVYCIIGWIWESLYVSLEYRKWVNRGFLNGPFLPIYGFGAIVMLFCTLPVRDNAFLTFLLGMLGATALEYLTGYVMEKMFHVRYWDYSYEFANLNGYICLGCSLLWGLASLFLIRVLHRPVENVILNLNKTLLLVIDIAFIVYFVWDLVVSARQAFDLRKIIDEQILQNEKILRLQKRLDVLIAVSEDNKERFHEALEEGKEKIQSTVEERMEKIQSAVEERMERTQNAIEESRERFQEKVADNRERYNEERERIIAEIEAARAEFKERTKTRKNRAMCILKRNPGTISKKLKLDKEAIKALFK